MYGLCMLVSASVIVFIALGTEYIVSYVDDILVPCQHDSVLINGKCTCDNTGGVFSGQYCEQCNCENAGICTMTSESNSGSRWGCRCPTHQKWVGVLCDKCYAGDHADTHCRGDCLNGYYGPQCNTLCVPDGSRTDLSDRACQEIIAGGGTCNACNGHGTCDPQGQCVCEDGYFTSRNGEQCGSSCDDNGVPCVHGTCTQVAGTLQCLCEPNFFGPSCEDTCPGLGCNGHGTCEYSSAGKLTCTCGAFHRGDACEKTCPGSSDYPVPCSGHGLCVEDQDAKCVCDQGWEGDACACSALYTCSGHGECSEESECICRDSVQPESHFDGTSCERCAPNWYGSNCDLYCDASADYDANVATDRSNIGCNGHGACSVASDGFGEFVECLCQGTDPDTFCATCVPGYFPDIRLSNLTTAPCSVECSARTCFNTGVCNDAYDGSNHLCICDQTAVGNITLDTIDPVQFCSTCRENWFPNDMASPNRCTRYCASDGRLQGEKEIFFQINSETQNFDLMGDQDAQKVCAASGDAYAPDADCRVCSNQGTCRGDGECECDAGTTGVYCNINCGANSDGTVCSNHGRCVRNELDMWFSPYSDTYRCECLPHDTYTTETRLRLSKLGFDVEPPPASHYYGELCEFHCPRYNENICAGRGDCTTAFSVNSAGDFVSCVEDLDCSEMDGSFCHRMQTPWDSLMTENVNEFTRSFFSNGVDSPGYIKCAESEECIDAIYSIEWDNFCVNMLNGWYPNDLNTAKCAYANEGQCQRAVETFFMEPYDGNHTWCESVKEKMIPPDSTCGRNTHANIDTHAAFETACHTYSLESTCNVQDNCIYDQTLNYIRQMDAECASRSPSECNSISKQCRLDGDGITCKTETYCRAKNCQDALLEQNVEHACFQIEPPCSESQNDWTNWCGDASGRIREHKEDGFTSLETFYGCYMYARRDNPMLPESSVPGGMTIRGSTELHGETISLQSVRRSFIDSRVTIDKNSACRTELEQWSRESFCDNHIASSIPSWYTTHLAPDAWFQEWLVVCHNAVSLFSTESEANDFVRTSSTPCDIYFKGIATQGSAFETGQDNQDSVGFALPVWTRKCPNKDDITFDTWEMSTERGCRDSYNEKAARWGGSLWSTPDVAKQFQTDCKKGLQASWIPKPDTFPSICDLGACAPGDQCFLCSDSNIDCGDTSASVMCESEFNMDCNEQNPCQKNGVCHQPGGMLRSATYVCDWTPTKSITVQLNNATKNASWTRYGHIVVPDAGLPVLTSSISVRKDDETRIITKWSRQEEGQISFMWSVPDTVELPLVPTKSEQVKQCEKISSSFNWYEYCDEQPLGFDLDMTPGNALPWPVSGNVFALNRYDILVDKNSGASSPPGSRFGVDIDLIASKGDLRIKCGDNSITWSPHRSLEPGQFTIHATSTKLHIEYVQSFDTCSFSSMSGEVTLTNLKLSGELVSIPFGDTLHSVGLRTFPPAPTNTSGGYESWSFDWTNRALRVERPLDDITASALQQCTIEQGQKVCPERSWVPSGVSWDMGQSFENVRVHGWSKFSNSETQVANVDVLNSENTSVVEMYVQSRRGLDVENMVYLNGVSTGCDVPTGEWWHWQLDIVHRNETRRTVYNHSRYGPASQVYEQEWHVSMAIGDCVYGVPHHLISGILEHTHRRKVAKHFLTHANVKKHECRSKCLEHSDCAQWSWTRNDHHCYLHSTHCGQDKHCLHGTANLHALASHKIRHVHVYSDGKGAASYFSNIRVEPILGNPDSWAPCLESQTVPEIWRDDFTWKSLEMDTTDTCNRLATDWSLLKEYPTKVCGPDATCRQTFDTRPSDLKACSDYIDAQFPNIDSDQCGEDLDKFLNLDWTSYCLYANSFDIHDTIVPFLGGVYAPMNETCKESTAIVQNASDTCGEPIDSAWYQQCFARTSFYEPFCSEQCLDYIDDMLSDSSTGPGLCSVRDTFLDMSSLADEGCECDMSQTVITDFCLIQGLYHTEDKIRVPELDNSKCSISCNDMLRDSFNRSQWRDWCSDLSNKNIKGVCSKTDCECDASKNIGVAGDTCELQCPTGMAETEELACSGPRNGRCFASVSSQQSTDVRQQTSDLREYRNDSLTPLWTKGPKPYMDGYCQCALGSGLSCSIPCDKCNNGTYGSGLTSQYGICNAFNGVCRALPPFMRFDVRYSDDVHSYNTTAFEDRNGVSAWTFPDRFLFESDAAVLERALKYARDPGGQDTGRVLMTTDVDFEQTNRIFDTLDVVNSLCWSEYHTHAMLFEYLDNDANKGFHGIEFNGNGMESTSIGSYSIDSYSGPCLSITIGPELRLCFDNGQFQAYLNLKGESLKVLTTHEIRIPQDSMSFAVRDTRTVYGFGGRNVSASSEDVFNDVFVFNIKRVAWEPRDIVFIESQPVQVTGDVRPMPSYNTPMWIFVHELYIFQQEGDETCAYRLRLPTGVNPAQWFKETCHTLDATIDYVSGVYPEVYIYTTANTAYTYSQNTWTPGAPASTPDPGIPPILVGMSSVECDVEVNYDNYTVKIGGYPFASHGPKSPAVTNTVRLFLDEMIYIDTSSNANVLTRAMNTIQWSISNSNTETTTEEMVSALDIVERVYMHQARWSRHRMTWTAYTLSQQTHTDVVQYLTITTAQPPDEFLNVFSDIPMSFLTTTPKISPTRIPTLIEGAAPVRKLVMHATYDANFDSYSQQVDIGGQTCVLTIEWRSDYFMLRLATQLGSGSIQWAKRNVFYRSWTLTIPVEQWSNSILSRDTFSIEESPVQGWRALFNLFVSTEATPEFKTSLQVSDFLAYTPGHCSISAGRECPGLLPYVHIPCSGRGKCTMSCRCICEEAPSVLASEENALDSIDVFNSPWRGQACELTCPGYDGYNIESVCSGRGTCQSRGTCSCEQGYTGDACQFECPKDENNYICSTHGACGTTAYEVSSFQFTNDDVTRDTLVATNRREYANALGSFYQSCAHDNYIRVTGDFLNGVYRSLNAGFTLAEAIELCENINSGLALDLAKEEYRMHPVGRCVGVTREDTHLYITKQLSPPQDTYLTFPAIIVFDCSVADCAVAVDEQDDRSISGLQHRLSAPSFSFVFDYVHGESSGQTHFIVNNQDMYVEANWDEHGIKVTLGNDIYGYTTVLENDVYTKRVVLTIESARLHVRVYPYPAISPTSSISWYAPDYNHKYMEMAELPTNAKFYNLLNTDTGTPRKLMNRDEADEECDKEPTCIGILRWRQVTDGIRYSLVTNKQYVEGTNLNVQSSEYTFHRKMSLVYKGKESDADSCSVLKPGLSRYPAVSYTEHYNAPLKDVDISSATDNETQAVVVGNGIWTNCWERVGSNMTKLECYNAANTHVPRVYGFAHSDEDGTCLIYIRITDPSQIQLNEFSSQAKLTTKQPCGDNSGTRWFT